MSDSWTTISSTKAAGLSPSQKKNLKKKKSKQNKQNATAPVGFIEPAAAAVEEIDEPAIKRALEESLVTMASAPVAKEAAEDPIVAAKRVQKKLRAIASLEERASRGSPLSEAEKAKLARKGELETDLALAEAEIAAEVAAAANAVQEEKQGMENVRKVEFDTDRFACPICCDVMDAATTVMPCEHTFCRECIEEALKRTISSSMTVAQRMEAVVCPLCRTALFNKSKGKVLTRPAAHLRKKIAKARGTCHCGEEMPLGTLREHLRHCGVGTAIFGERKQYKNEFEQPPVLDAPSREGWQWTGRAYDEDAMMQAALAESLGSSLGSLDF